MIFLAAVKKRNCSLAGHTVRAINELAHYPHAGEGARGAPYVSGKDLNSYKQSNYSGMKPSSMICSNVHGQSDSNASLSSPVSLDAFTLAKR